MTGAAMDPRVTPANDRVALGSLRGQVQADRFTDGTWQQVQAPLVDLCDAPHGPRSQQLLLGAAFLVLEERDGVAFGQAQRDGYVGYVNSLDLGPLQDSSHWVAQRSSHIYSKADFKSAELAVLPFGARLSVKAEIAQFAELVGGGFVPMQHLLKDGQGMQNLASAAETFLGTPYLWGGNSGAGIDCSGLVQAAVLACGLACPRDSDQQRRELGDFLPDGAVVQRGDLIFWRGHVGLMLDDAQLLHANAHHMAVACEPFEDAQYRISRQEFGEILARKRIPL